jgi:hypothetical protein
MYAQIHVVATQNNGIFRLDTNSMRQELECRHLVNLELFVGFGSKLNFAARMQRAAF